MFEKYFTGLLQFITLTIWQEEHLSTILELLTDLWIQEGPFVGKTYNYKYHKQQQPTSRKKQQQQQQQKILIKKSFLRLITNLTSIYDAIYK
jgi:hypothetical protein